MIFPEVNLIETGKNIIKLRKEKGLSRQNLADLLYVKYCTVWTWEIGKRCPEIDNLLALSFIFNVKLDDLLVIRYPQENPNVEEIKGE